MAERERSSEDIRREIAGEKENLSQTVEQIGDCIKEKLDWRAQVNDSPYWALGAAAGLGFLASKVFARRVTPMERMLGSLAEDVSSSLGGHHSTGAGTRLIRMTLLSFAARAATDWIRDECPQDSGTLNNVGPRPRTGRESNIDPETTM